MNIAPTVELNSNKLLCDCVGVRQRGAEARGRVVFLEDQRWEVQVGRRASRLPVPDPQPDQIPGERRETPPLLPPPGKHWNLPAFLIIWLRFFFSSSNSCQTFFVHIFWQQSIPILICVVSNKQQIEIKFQAQHLSLVLSSRASPNRI